MLQNMSFVFDGRTAVGIKRPQMGDYESDVERAEREIVERTRWLALLAAAKKYLAQPTNKEARKSLIIVDQLELQR